MIFQNLTYKLMNFLILNEAFPAQIDHWELCPPGYHLLLEYVIIPFLGEKVRYLPYL